MAEPRIMELENSPAHSATNRLRASVPKRLMAAAIILQVTLFSPTSNFAALRNLKKKTADSSLTTRSLKLAGKAARSFSVSPSIISVSPAATNGTVNVINASREEWSVSNSIPWITVTIPANRAQTSQLLTYSVNPNTSCANRVGVFFVKSRAVTITQSGVPVNYLLSSESANVAADGGSGSVTLTANCLWSVQSDASWIAILSPLNGSDNTTIVYLVGGNSGNASRGGSIKIFDGNSVLRRTLTVTQSSVPPNHALSSASAVFTSTGGTSNVVLTALASWSVQTDVSWITDISPTSGDGNATISYTVAENIELTARNGRIKILDANSVVKQILTVGQSSASANYSLGSSSADFTSNGGNSSVQLFATSAWTVQSDADWISGLSPLRSVGDRSIGYSVAANPSCTSRTGLIKILDANSVVQKKLTITQAGISGEYTVSSSYLLFPSSGGRISVGVAAKCSWTVQADVSWISNIVPSSGNGNATVFYTVAQNTTPDGRQGFIRIQDANSVVQQTLRVVQTGVAPTYWLNPSSAGFPSSGGSNMILLTANAAWTAQADVEWITGLAPASGNTNATLRYAVSSNTNSASRVGSINIYDGTATLRETFSVVQSGAPSSSMAANRPSGSYAWSTRLADGTATATDTDGNRLTAGNVAGKIYFGKTAPDGTVLWVKWLQGGVGQPGAIASDNEGNIYLAGQFSGAVDLGGCLLTSSAANIFLAKYSGDGTYLWSKSFDGTGEDFVETIALDRGNILMVGSFISRIDFGGAAEYELVNSGAPAIFLANLSGEAGQYIWSQQLGDFSNPQADAAITNYLARLAQP